MIGDNNLSKNLVGSFLNINGRQVIDGSCNLFAENALIKGGLSVQGDLTVNGETLTSTIDTAVATAAVTIPENIDVTNSIVRVFEATSVEVGDIVERELFTQVNHSRSILELKIFMHDINSNTFWGYSDGKYMWYREWTNTAQETVIGTPVNIGSGDPLHYTVERFQVDNVVSVRITQNTPFATNTQYKIIAKIVQC